MRGTIWITTVAVCAVACGGRESIDAGRDATVRMDGGSDAGARDAGSFDAGRDAATADAGSDASLADAGGDSAADGGSDAGADAGSDAGTDAGLLGTPVIFECVPAVAGNESASGMVLSSMFSTGFRFEIGAGPDVLATAMEINLQTATGGTIFGAIVRLTSSTDTPDSPDLTSSDVIATTTIPVPGGPMSFTASGPVSVTLAPGWYAAVFGTAAFGATLPSATVHSNSGAGGCGSGFGFPFSIRKSDGMLILQAATPHFAVTGLRP